jgi:hypothetical protein
MPLYDLTGNKVSFTYPRLLQYVSGSLYDGIGNPVFISSSNVNSASYAFTSSYAFTASYETNIINSSSYSDSSSYSLNSNNSVSASYSLSSSYSYNSISSSYSLSASYGISSSYSNNSNSSSYSLNSNSSSYSLNSATASISNTSSFALNGTYNNLSTVTTIGSLYELVVTPTGSYDNAFFDYGIKSGSNSRCGTVFGCWNDNNMVYTEYTTVDIGNTTQITMSMDISASNVRLLAIANTTNNWSIKTSARYL